MVVGSWYLFPNRDSGMHTSAAELVTIRDDAALLGDPMNRPLLIFISSEIIETTVRDLGDLVSGLARARVWTVCEPEFVDQTDDSSCSRPEDLPIRTVGAALDVTDPSDVPSTPIEEVEWVLGQFAKFSTSHRVDFEIELNGTYVGGISRGVFNQTLVEGLLETW